MQTEVVKYQDTSGAKLEREWFVQAVEALANVLVGLVGLVVSQGGPSPDIPYKKFAVSGLTQVLAKAMTQKAMIFGVPFFVATLVKNAKMVPVMLGAIVMSGKKYHTMQFVTVSLIVAGVVLVSLGKAKSPKASKSSDTESLGLACLAFALVCDGESRLAAESSSPGSNVSSSGIQRGWPPPPPLSPSRSHFLLRPCAEQA